ncbi:hypothetical protein CHS0354_005913 [Potamilus streckersoni]|uniref:Prokineticin domain-containing protein n=1 Tax=Potamilus streckersoni TaxID=2493646 RepID=A0AAE0T313_9BIVA|nr:hypothetical protein CHS0354_005913 [Potamilus streckersoni]
MPVSGKVPFETVSNRMLFLVFALSFSTAAALQGMVCHSDYDCGHGECCYIPSPFQVLSKKQAVLPLQPVDLTSKSGTCERYRTIGEHCNPLEKMNGHCGCGHGLYCHHTPPPTLATVQAFPNIVRRKLLPGTYECAETV